MHQPVAVRPDAPSISDLRLDDHDGDGAVGHVASILGDADAVLAHLAGDEGDAHVVVGHPLEQAGLLTARRRQDAGAEETQVRLVDVQEEVGR